MLRSTITRSQLSLRVRALLAGPAGRRLRVPAAAVISVLLLNALVYAFAVLPASSGLAARQERAADLRRQYADALLFQKQKQALSGLKEGALTQKDVPLLVKDLVGMARRQNLTVGAVTSDIPAPASGGLNALSFTVPLGGAYGSIKRYLYEIETTDRLIGIQDLRISSDKKGIKADLKLITYIRGE